MLPQTAEHTVFKLNLYRMYADFCAIQAYQTHPHLSDWKELGAAWQLLIKVEERLMVDRF